jgi:hypothetical protein
MTVLRALLDVHRSPSRLRWATALALVALALSAFPLHSGLEQHGALDGPTRVFVTATKAGGASRLESARAVELPPCLACVLQLQTLGSTLPVAQQLAVLVPFGVAATPHPPLLDLAARRIASSRGPPRA